MHVEPPKAAFHGLKDFAKEYAMLVVGILTALGLEQVATKYHRSHAAAQSRQQILQELQANLDEVRDSLKTNEGRLKPISALIREAEADLLAHRPKAETLKHIDARMKQGLSVGLSIPTLRHEAWDVAVANQTAAHIPPASLLRFSALYATQRDIQAANQITTQLFSGGRMIDAFTALELGQGEPLELVRVFRQVELTQESNMGNLKQLERELAQKLEEEAKGPKHGH